MYKGLGEYSLGLGSLKKKTKVWHVYMRMLLAPLTAAERSYHEVQARNAGDYLGRATARERPHAIVTCDCSERAGIITGIRLVRRSDGTQKGALLLT